MSTSPMPPSPLRSPPPASGERGFTLIETLVGLAITVEVLLVALLLFDVNSRIARNQVQIADMQQSQRIAHNEMTRTVRLAGRGGLPQDRALVLQNDVAVTDTVNGNAPVAGTDILTLRGVLGSPLYQIRPDDGTVYYTPPGGGDTGSIIIPSYSPTNIEQPLDPFDEIPSVGGNRQPFALLLVSANTDSVYAVVEATSMTDVGGNVDLNGDGMNDRRIRVDFTKRASGNGLSARFDDLNSTPGAFPAALNQNNAVGFAGILEEIRYYVRSDTTATTGYSPKLARAHFYPNTNIVLGEDNANDSNPTWGRIDIAENVLDLQVALLRDTNGDGVIDSTLDGTTAAGADEYQFNAPTESVAFAATHPIFNVQVATLARTDRFDRGFTSDPVTQIFDNPYNESPLPTNDQQRTDRSYRRQLLTSTVDLRNLN